ncbi:hypothetical protein DFH11DRAFT_1573061 [Phellopilus nigrolimitatus]|nr:hypothetical protein DFH11DRAFT_1573061 [Phellopilus nigrolimitatus]
MRREKPPSPSHAESPKVESSDSEALGQGVDQAERPKEWTNEELLNCRKDEAGIEQGERATTASSSGVVVKPSRRIRLTGRLAMMMSMPIDVFCEVAHYLGPDDLLHMSRSAKVLRELLMSKSSKPIWRSAEEAAGLPECPPDLNSPQYASFIYDTFCTSVQASHCSACSTL